MSPTIDIAANVELAPETKQNFIAILESMFPDHERLVIEKEFAGNLSGSWVFLVRPIREQHRELPRVVKIASKSLIEKEWQAYNGCIANRWPRSTKIESQPVRLPGIFSGLSYALVGEGVFRVESLRSYCLSATPKDIRAVFERLSQVLEGVYRESSQLSDFCLRATYDAILPINLWLKPISCLPVPEQEALLLTPQNRPVQLPPIGTVVRLEDFVVTKVDLKKQTITLNVPRLEAGLPADSYSLRLKFERNEEMPDYQIGQPILPTEALVIETRQRQWQQEMRALLAGQSFAFESERVVLPDGTALPNPFYRLSDLLEQRLEIKAFYIHGDFNLENILVDPDVRDIHLIDFAEARWDHLLHDFLRLETEVVTKLITPALVQNGLPITRLCQFYEHLHLATFHQDALIRERAARTPTIHAALQNSFVALMAIRRVVRQYALPDPKQYAVYYDCLTVYLLGALKFSNLNRDASIPKPWPKEVAFWSAALARKVRESTYDKAQVEEILPALPSEDVQFWAPSRPQHKLVGRDELLNQLRGQLMQGNSLAISAMSGLPGVGKTALAIELAHDEQIRARFPDGVLWAALGRHGNAFTLLGEWGMALGFSSQEIARLSNLRERATAIHRLINQRRMLLVVDDAWDSINGLAFRIGGPNCAHLLTTRYPNIALDFAGNNAKIVQELNETDSLTLLAHFVPDLVATQPEAVRALVKATGGLPLALILMGRQLRKVAYQKQPDTLSDILERLQQVEERLRLAEAQAPLEQQASLPIDVPLSLLASIQLSDETLSEPCRQTLRALSAFPPKPNSFSEEAALVVSEQSNATLNELLEAGLLESSAQKRYTLHQAIHDYASLEVQAKHKQRAADYFAAFAQTHQQSADGYRQLDTEWQNMQHIISWAREQQAWPSLLPSIQALTEPYLGVIGFMEARGYWREASLFLKEALKGTQASNDSQLRASILIRLGAFAFRQAEFDAAADYLKESNTILDSLPPSSDVALQQAYLYEFMSRLAVQHDPQAALNWVVQGLTALDDLPSELAQQQKGHLYVWQSTIFGRTGKFYLAMQAAEKGLALLPASPTSARIVGLITLSNVSAQRGEIDKSIDYQKEGIHLAQELGDSRRLATLWMNVGNNESRRAKYSAAQESYQKALPLYQRIGDAYGESNLYGNLGLTALVLGQDEAALTHLTNAIALAARHQLLKLEALAKTNLANLHIYRGELADATSALKEAAQICQQLELTFLMPGILYWQAETARLRGSHQQAMTLIEKSLEVAIKGGYVLAEGIAWSIKGKILDGMGSFDEALVAHQKSLQLLAEQSPYDLAHSQLALGQHYLTCDQQMSQRANAWLLEALTTFEALGAKRESALIKGLL